jgi:hypothetical protein
MLEAYSRAPESNPLAPVGAQAARGIPQAATTHVTHPAGLAHDIDGNAPVIVNLTITIEAPLPVVWRQRTNINAWPTWQADVSRAVLSGPLRPGTTFD